MSQSAGTRRALVASLWPDPALAALAAACDPWQLTELAIAEGLAGPVQARLGGLLPAGPLARLATEARRDAVRHLAYLGLLGKFAVALDKASVTWVALKGPVLAELSYPVTPRSYADLDLLVAPGQLREAVGALRDAGAVLGGLDWRQLLGRAKGELSLTVYGLPMVDLHWHPVYLRSARERWAIATDELLGRRRPVRLKDVDAWSLDPTDLVAHLAVHASLGAAEQLRRLLDIERTIASQAPDWEELVRRCRAWRVALPVGVMLGRARRTLGAAVPDAVVAELAGGRLNRLLVRQLSGWTPAGHLPGGRSVRNGLTRSLGDDFRSTAGDFATDAWRLIARPLRPAATESGHDNNQSAAAGFERYLEMVSGMDRYGHLKP